MPGDGGLIVTLADWMVTQLAALQYNGSAVFAISDLFRHQLRAAQGGLEGIEKTPVCYVDYMNSDSAREGDNALREILEFDVLVVTKSKEIAVAKWGDDSHIGISKIRDLVIALFDKQRPDAVEIDCDEFYYAGDNLTIDTPNLSGVQMRFEVSRMNN
ncbi:MAG: hypothetical protein WCZ89_02290 [Phycisphaerae bacterium]